MKVLLLSPEPDRLMAAFSASGDVVVVSTDAVNLDWCQKNAIDWIVSYGYRHMIREPMLSFYSHRIVNLHISYLPWNKGADPNFWSWFDDTAKGVSIHYVDRGLDTGPILGQKAVAFTGHETLATSYQMLKSELERLFICLWPALRLGTLTGAPQQAGGSQHRSQDRIVWAEQMSQGWNTPVAELVQMGRRHRMQNLVDDRT